MRYMQIQSHPSVTMQLFPPDGARHKYGMILTLYP